MPRFRFTVRRMMIAVAGIALLFGAETLRRRSDSYRARAAYHGHEEEMQQYLLNGGFRVSTTPTEKATFTRMKPTPKATAAGRFADEAPERQAASQGFLVESLDRSTLEERRARHASLKAKYERAARYPWLPVAPTCRIRSDAERRRVHPWRTWPSSPSP